MVVSGCVRMDLVATSFAALIAQGRRIRYGQTLIQNMRKPRAGLRQLLALDVIVLLHVRIMIGNATVQPSALFANVAPANACGATLSVSVAQAVDHSSILLLLIGTCLARAEANREPVRPLGPWTGRPT